MERFKPTHVLVLTDRETGRQVEEKVMAVNGVCYTREEWNAGARADWSIDGDGHWHFQGQPAPAGQIVEVRRV